MSYDRFCIPVIFIGISLIFLAGCQGQKTAAQKTSDSQNQATVQQKEPPLPGYPDGDTIVWRDVAEEYRPTPVTVDGRELPGERLGLSGPIVAQGGTGRKAYITVYDSAGVMVGGMLKSEVKNNPQEFHRLFQLALQRSEFQSSFALEKMRQNGALDR